MNNLTLLTHTHTECSDIWEPYFDSIDTYFNGVNHIILINNHTEKIKNKKVIYNEGVKFSDRLLYGLEQISTDYVIISLEDMILYDSVNLAEINRIIELLNQKKDIPYVRLIKSGINSSIEYENNLKIMSNDDFLFSITPTIWRVSTLKQILLNLRNYNIWELEINGDALLKITNQNYLYYYNNESKRGGNHYNSSIYPHMCSAIFKGKWNITEYGNELSVIFKKYNIDARNRGTF